MFIENKSLERKEVNTNSQRECGAYNNLFKLILKRLASSALHYYAQIGVSQSVKQT